MCVACVLVNLLLSYDIRISVMVCKTLINFPVKLIEKGEMTAGRGKVKKVLIDYIASDAEYTVDREQSFVKIALRMRSLFSIM